MHNVVTNEGRILYTWGERRMHCSILQYLHNDLQLLNPFINHIYHTELNDWKPGCKVWVLKGQMLQNWTSLDKGRQGIHETRSDHTSFALAFLHDQYRVTWEIPIARTREQSGQTGLCGRRKLKLRGRASLKLAFTYFFRAGYGCSSARILLISGVALAFTSSLTYSAMASKGFI